MFIHIAQALNPQQLERITANLGADAPWVDGRVTAGYQGAPVKHNQQLDESSAAARALGDVVLSALEHNAHFVSAALPNRVYPPLFNRYLEGMHFGTHVDGAIRRIPGTSHKLRADLSATLFLVAPDTYDGGELVMEAGSASRPAGHSLDSQSFKGAAGDLIVYPTTSPHRVNPVTRGARLASVFWIQSLVREQAQRTELFELDCTIARLTATAADSQSLVRLASHYHNLLRHWSLT